MTFATGVGFSVAGVAGSWESGAGMHGGLSLGSSASVSANSGSGPSAYPGAHSLARGISHETEALQLPVRAGASEACHGGGVKDLTSC